MIRDGGGKPIGVFIFVLLGIQFKRPFKFMVITSSSRHVVSLVGVVFHEFKTMIIVESGVVDSLRVSRAA